MSTPRGKATVLAGRAPDSPVDPLRGSLAGGHAFAPTATQAARGVLNSRPVMDELLRLMAWIEPAQMDALVEAWQEAKAGNTARLEMYRTQLAATWARRS